MNKKNKPSTSPKVNGSNNSETSSELNFYTDYSLLSDKSQESLSPTYTEVSELHEKFTPKHKKYPLVRCLYAHRTR